MEDGYYGGENFIKTNTIAAPPSFLSISTSRLLDTSRIDDYYEYVVTPLFPPNNPFAHSLIVTHMDRIHRAMCRDETIYEDAETFNPERFEGERGSKVLDPRSFVFGFGRRYNRCAPYFNLNKINGVCL